MDNSTSATIHVYGGRAALTIEPCMNSASDFHTLMLEIAPKTESGVDWSRKITIQPTYQEFPLLVATFLGYHSHLQLKRDGKWMELEEQPKAIYIKGGTANCTFAMPVTPGDRVRVSALLLQQYAQNHPGLAPGLLIAALQTTRRSKA
jgi:hypothetical protein